MACRQIGAELLLKTMLTYYQSDPKEPTVVKFGLYNKIFFQ